MDDRRSEEELAIRIIVKAEYHGFVRAALALLIQKFGMSPEAAKEEMQLQAIHHFGKAELDGVAEPDVLAWQEQALLELIADISTEFLPDRPR